MGFEEGRNLTVVRRSAAGQFDKLPALAQELVSQKVDAIVAMGGPIPTRAAKAATTTIPIVFAYGGDPVGDGLVASFNRPGGNVTGASFMGASFTSKRLQVLKQLLPQAVDVALMLNPKATLAEGQIRDARAAAPVLGQKIQVMNASGAEEIDAASPRWTGRRWRRCWSASIPATGWCSATASLGWPPSTSSGALRLPRLCREGWPHLLRQRADRHVAAGRPLCRPDPQGREAAGPAGGAAHAVRDGDRTSRPRGRSASRCRPTCWPWRTTRSNELPPGGARGTPYRQPESTPSLGPCTGHAPSAKGFPAAMAERCVCSRPR